MRSALIVSPLVLFAVTPALADDQAECRQGIARLRAEIASKPKAAQAAELRQKSRRAERELGERQYAECLEIVGGPDEDKEDERPETTDVFGFTTGTDVIEPGKVELSQEFVGAFGRRFGRYRAGTFRSSVEFAPVNGFSIEVGAHGNTYSIRDVPGLDNRSFTSFGGLSAELKWQIVKRGPTPFGLTLIAEPSFGLIEAESGARGRFYGLETRLALDTALIPNTLFAGLNLIYEAEKGRERGFLVFNSEGEQLENPSGGDDEESQAAFARRRPAERSSRIGISGALSYQIVPNVFVGMEARYMRAYDGLALRDFEGQALFLGPTLYTSLGKGLSLSAAWSYQVAGKAEGLPGRLDLVNFSRHEAKLKLSYEF
jgi:hypothetical protein